MPFRDESETLRARIEVLERELADAKDTIARLRGEAVLEGAETAAVQTTKPSWLFHAPSQLAIRREIDSEATRSAILATASLLKNRFGQYGHLTEVAGALTYRVGTLELTLTPTKTGTHLQLLLDHRGMMMMPFVFAIVGGFTALPIFGSLSGPSAALLAMIAGLLVGFMASRAVFARWVRGYQARCHAVFAAIAEIVAQNAKPKARIAAEADDEEDEDVESEAPAWRRRAE